jgi:predicted Zn-dependent protease
MPATMKRYLLGAARGDGQPPQWLSTHPAHETCLRDLQDYAQRVLPLYATAVK